MLSWKWEVAPKLAVVGATSMGANFIASVTKIKVAVKLAVVGATTLGANFTDL